MLVAKGGVGVWSFVYGLLDRELNAKRLATWAPAAAACSGVAKMQHKI
tara:strand:- start:828 stop:971 length:144 start_codon:yes stop_codon:yes gene_type:complete